MLPVSWKVNRELALLLGWSAALAMQLAHPLVAAAVAQHSVFAADPRRRLERLYSTVRSMLTLTFGDEAEVAGTVARIRGIHDRVHGRLDGSVGAYGAATTYSAHDPALLAWVHATTMHAYLRTYELFVGPLSEAERDDYCRSGAGVGAMIGIPEHLLPTTAAALAGGIERAVADGTVRVGPDAAALVRELRSPPLPWWSRPLAGPLLLVVEPLNRLTTIALLPPELRAQYALPWTPADARRLDRVATLLRAAHRLTPGILHHWPIARRAAARRLPSLL